MIPRPNRSASLDHSKIIETQRTPLPATFQLTSYQNSLRLRHLTQIIGSNLEVSKDIIQPPIHNILPAFIPRVKSKIGFYFTLESSNMILPHFTSECHQSNCPTWDSFDCNTIFPIHLRSLKDIVICVWYKTEKDESHYITSWIVHFSGLVPLPTASIQLHQFPVNTLILKISSYYYTSIDCIRNTQLANEDVYSYQLQTGFYLPLSETKPSYGVPSLCRLQITKRTINQQLQNIKRLEDQLEYKGVKNNSDRMILKNKLENIHVKVSLLRDKLSTKVINLKAIQSAANKLDLENQDKGIELLESFQLLNRQLATLKNKEERLLKDHSWFIDVLRRVKERRLQLLSQIPLVFPVEKVTKDTKNYSICGVFLPNAECYGNSSEQTLSVALGFVAQLLVKLACVVNIPLKYPVTLRGSASSIADLTSTQLQDVITQFPLYTRGKEKEKFHFNYAVFLLNKNIAQLRWSCGLPTHDLRTTLVNISELLQSFRSFNLTQTRAFMPDTVVLQPILPISLRQIVLLQPTLHNSYRYSLSHQDNHATSLLNKCVIYSDSDAGGLSGGAEPCEVVTDMSRSESDNENKSDEGKTNLSLKNNYSLSSSCSLDKGLNNNRSINMLKSCHLSGDKFLPNCIRTSASSPDLTVASTKNVDRVYDNSLSELHQQTTELLKSWHEDNPTPYGTISAASSSVERLDYADTTSHSPKVGQLSANKIAREKSLSSELINVECNDIPQNFKCELDNALQSELEGNKHLSATISKGTSFKGNDVSLLDCGLSDESFLTDVASRTANLVSQNCSFKMLHSKQSTQD